MRKICCILMMMFALFSIINVDAKKDKPLTYEISCGGSGIQGYSLVKVKAVVDSKKDIGDNILKRCAVHGILFRGYSGTQGCVSQPPLAGSAIIEQQFSDFFVPFFQPGGGCESYCTLVDGSLQTVKQGKQFVVSGIISVAKSQLRNDLEKAGVIKKLNSGF